MASSPSRGGTSIAITTLVSRIAFTAAPTGLAPRELLPHDRDPRWDRRDRRTVRLCRSIASRFEPRRERVEPRAPGHGGRDFLASLDAPDEFGGVLAKLAQSDDVHTLTMALVLLPTGRDLFSGISWWRCVSAPSRWPMRSRNPSRGHCVSRRPLDHQP